MGDIRPPYESAERAFGLDALVTYPGGATVETTAIWLPFDPLEAPVGGQFQRVESRKVIALSLVGAAQVPLDTVITVAEYEGATASDWKVQSHDRHDSHHQRVVVIPVPEES
jgi:hypothetical protein